MKDLIPPPTSLPPKSIVWAYLRDSGGDSQEQSVGQQRNEIVSYCARYGLVLAKVFADEAKTGGTDKGRDFFAEMIDTTDDLKQRPAGLLIWSLSRFARNQNDSPYYRAMLRKRDIVIHSLTEILPDDPTAIVIEAVYDFTNAEKLRQTSRDVKRGLHSLARQGFAPGGFPPRGYKAEEVVIGHKRDGTPRKVSRWVIDPEVAPLVQKAFALAAAGGRTREIARATDGKLYKSSGSWSTFFSNKTYLGILKCGDEEIEGALPALVDRDTWEAVQLHRRGRAQSKVRKKPYRGVLSGFAVCCLCGSAMLHSSNQAWRFYVCGKKHREGAPACLERRVGADKVEAKVLDRVTQRIVTPELAEVLIAQAQNTLHNSGDIEAELATLKGEIADLKRKIAHLNDQIENFGATQSTHEKLIQRENQLREKQARQSELEAQKQAGDISVEPEALALVFNTWIDRLKKVRQSNDIIAIQTQLRQFVKEVQVGYKTTRVHYRFPISKSAYSKHGEVVWGHTPTNNFRLKE